MGEHRKCHLLHAVETQPKIREAARKKEAEGAWGLVDEQDMCTFRIAAPGLRLDVHENIQRKRMKINETLQVKRPLCHGRQEVRGGHR